MKLTKTRPSLLGSPNIPQPLHGINPRSIAGKQWWDVQRRKAYTKSSYCCSACGVHMSLALYHQWLEAHEDYNINWKTGQVSLREIVALCHACHNFIHSDRLKEMTKKKAKEILTRGLSLCLRHDVRPFYISCHSLAQIKGVKLDRLIKTYNPWYPPSTIAQANLWYLLFKGRKYYIKP